MKHNLKHRWLILALSMLLLMVTVYGEPTCVVRGWLRGEAFYKGRPTSYWRQELKRWQECAFGVTSHGNSVHQHASFRRTPDVLDNIAGLFGIRQKSYDLPDLVKGNPAAGDVLRKLAQDPDSSVQHFAAMALDRRTTLSAWK